MYTDEELAETIRYLNHPEPQERAIMLVALWNWLSKDPRLLSHLEALLEDRTPCAFGRPRRLTEIRWLAAQALAAEYRAQGLRRPISLAEDTVTPVPAQDLVARANLPKEVLLDLPRLCRIFVELREQGELPRVRRPPRRGAQGGAEEEDADEAA